MSSWKFDASHVIIVVAFLAGLAWYVCGHLAGQPLTMSAVMPVAVVALSAVFGFFKSPPDSPVEAASEGAGVPLAAKRGFAATRAILFAGVLGLAALVGCSWFAANEKVVTTDSAATASCVLSQVFLGDVLPLTITAACAPATLADVVQIVESIVQFYSAPADAGPDGAASAALDAHCGSGAPPIKGLPACLDDGKFQQLVQLRDQAKASLAK